MENSIPKLVFVSYGDILYDNGYKTRLMGELSMVKNMAQWEKYLISFEKPNSWNKNQASIKSLTRELSDQNIKLKIVPRQNQWQFDFYKDERKFREILEEINFQAGILHGQSVYGTYLCLPHKTNQVKIIFDMHGLVGPEWQLMGKNLVKKWVNQWLENQCINQSDYILTASNSLKNYLADNYKKDNTATFPGLVDEKKFPHLSVQTIPYLRKKLQLPDKIITVYAGGMQDWQDFSQIINLIKQHDWFLLVMTNDTEKAELKFKEISTNVLIMSAPHAKMYEYLQLADWGWLVRQPNLLNKISFPTKAAEYLICGLPIVHNGNIDDVSAIIGQNRLGWNLSGSSEKWMDIYQANSPEIKENCRLYAEKNLTWKNKTVELLNVYQRLSSKKICYLITTGFWGGAQKYVLDLANYFKVDHDVEVMVGQNGGKLIRKLKKEGIKTTAIENLVREVSPIQDLRAGWQLFNYFKNNKPDILHINSSKAGVIGRLAGRLAGVDKVYYTAHGWVFNEDIGWLKKTFYKIIEVGLSWLTDKIFCVSEYDKQTGILAGINPKKIQVIYNGVAVIPYEEGFPYRKQLAKWRLKYKIIGNISNYFANKNLLFWLQVVKESRDKYPDWRWVLVGTGPQKELIEEKIREYELGDIVRLTGQLNGIESIIKYFDVLTLLSKKEGLPYVLLEAIKAKVPVVSTKAGGVPEIITSDFGELVAVNDIKGTIMAMEKMLKKNITTQLPDKFTMKAMLREYQTAYQCRGRN